MKNFIGKISVLYCILRMTLLNTVLFMKSPKLQSSLLAMNISIFFSSMKYFQETNYSYYNFLTYL